MKFMKEKDAITTGIYYLENYIENYFLGTRVYTRLLTLFGTQEFDTSIYQGIAECKITQVNPLAGWYKVQDSEELIPIDCMGTAEKVYTVSYLAEATCTQVYLSEAMDEMSTATAISYYKLFKECDYITVVTNNEIVYDRCLNIDRIVNEM